MAYTPTIGKKTHRNARVASTLEVDVEANVATLKVGGVSVDAANASLADVNATAAELNQLVGITTGVVPHGIPLNNFRAPAAWKDDLGDTATAAILGLADTRGSVLLASDASSETINQSAVACFTLPATYQSGAPITVRLRAKQATALSTTSSKVDVVAKLIGDTLGADICATASQQVTTSYANYDFDVTPTSLVAGDILAIEVFCIDIDVSDGGAMSISRVEMRLNNA